MDNNIKFDINLEVLGMPQMQQATSAIKAMGTLVGDFSSFTAPLAKITTILENICQKIDKFGNIGKKSLDKVETESEKAQKELKNVGASAEEAGKQVKESLFDKLGNSSFNFNNLLGAVQNVASKIAPIFEEGMARETAAVNFGTLFNDKEVGKQYADQLRGTNAAALYGTSTVNDAAKNMLAFGIDAQTTKDTIERLGDIAMGDAQKLGSLSLAFAQISSAGKLGGQDLMQLINAGFNPLEEISKKTGKSIGQLKEEMSKGAISAEDVAEAIKSATEEGGKFNGALKDVMDNTLQGKMATLQGAFDDIKAKLYDLALPIVMKVVPVITDQLIPAFMSAIDFISPIFDLIADNLDTVGVFVGVLGALAAIIGVVNAVMSVNPISLVIIGIAALIAIIYKVIDAYDRWGAAVTFLLGPLGMIINLVMTIKRYWDDIVNAFESDGIMAGLKRIGVMLLDVVLYPVQQLLELLSNIPGLGDLAGKGADFIKGMREGLGAIDPEKKESKEETKETSSMDSAVAAVNSNTGGGSGSADLASATGKGKESVASGGTRNTQITINLGNMVENVNFQGGVDDNKDSLTSQLEECLLRVLYSATSAV